LLTICYNELINNVKESDNYNNNLFSKDKKFKIFVSYAREDEEAARRLYNDLKNSNLPIEPWLDKEEILPGQDWKREIRKAINESIVFIPVLSSTSVKKRGYVQAEVKYGIEVLKEIPPGEIFVIPVRVDPCEIPYDELKQYHVQDLFSSWDNGSKMILKSIKSLLNNNATNKN
jgi:TIR domain